MKTLELTDGKLILGDCLDVLKQMSANSVDMVFGSPPYCDARTYNDETFGGNISRNARAWVDWMLEVTKEAVHVSKGPVMWVCAGVTRDRTYWPACEGLAWEWYKAGGSAYRPCYWHRVGIPGSGGDQWFRADMEYVLCFKKPGPLPVADPLKCGMKPKYGPGGPVSHRNTSGKRTGSGKSAIPKVANPGNLVSIVVGGGKLGSKLAHENEAPYPVNLPKYFIKCFTEPGMTVLDPFGGSGTTVAAAIDLGRKFVAIDVRKSQVKLMRRRIKQSENRKGLFHE